MLWFKLLGRLNVGKIEVLHECDSNHGNNKEVLHECDSNFGNNKEVSGGYMSRFVCGETAPT